MPMACKPIKYVIFDMDGLLLDTETLYTKVFSKLFAQWGHQFTLDFKVRLMGLSAIESAILCTTEYSLPVTPEEFHRQALEAQLEEFKSCSLMPGVDKLLGHLSSIQIPLAIATSSRKETYNVKTSSHQELFKVFKVVVNGDDPSVLRAKPHPDIFLTAAQRLGAKPEECLVFEDSPNGVRAALAAGMSVIWVPDAAYDFTVGHGDIVDHPEITKLNSLNEFQPEPWGLS